VSTNTGTPRDRASVALTWSRGPWEVTGTWNHISSFAVTDSSYAMPDCASALSLIFPNGLPRTGSPLCKVGSFGTLNLSGRYQVSRQLTLRGSISNVLDRKAPIDAFASSSAGGGVSSGGAHYDPALHQDGAVGRYFNVGLSYNF
jgi:iron complex outermembrane receptor protein